MAKAGPTGKIYFRWKMYSSVCHIMINVKKTKIILDSVPEDTTIKGRVCLLFV